ncbi:MAG TPA: hypothetical protein VK356_09995 [Thermomicrobiales bacterium]|nr:hypothetical protein [Thermomicrobiales bacterium]
MDEARKTVDALVSPRQIALTYDRVVSAHWRGETDTATAFDAWFEAHWSDQAPPEPDTPPEGTSVLGDSGAGIRWYARDATVLGYVSRRPNGCYRVPMREALPALMASWDVLELEAARQPDTDQMLRQTGTRPLPAQPTSNQREPAVSVQRVRNEPVHLLDITAAGNSSGAAAGS